ncbi:fungal-specific transcription factor domain-containing protein [Hysterangium stoloniferum]|nr:fungal-specific transcription factor domain-containing protein [Hysterangium stoloniferum]
MASSLPALPQHAHRAVRSSGKPHSCAECRRLKLRCDRVFPCESCRKRNVAALCPNGSLPPRPRLLAEDAVKLSKTIAELTNRCRQLEDALRTLQAKYSNDNHPLLETKFLPSYGSDALTSPVHESFNPDDDQDDIDSIQDSLGTLTIDSSGNSNFLGRTAGMHSDDPEMRDLLPREIQNIVGQSLPSPIMFANLANDRVQVLERMKEYLPASGKAWALCETYFQHAAWLCHPVTRECMDEIFALVYNPSPTSSHREENDVRARPEAHELSLIFMVFSVATLLDLSFPPNNMDAEFYHQLARAGLSCASILVEPTVPAIQTLFLMSYYHWLGNRKYSEQISWGIMGLVVNLSQNVGLHRDSAAWRLLEQKTVERQRLLLWELYALELTEALNFGRPPSLSLSTIDCKMPADSTQFAFPNDALDPPFHSTKYRFFSVYLSPVIEAILGAKTANYSTVLALDRKVRDQDVAPLIEFDTRRAPGDPIVDLTGATLGVTMQKFMIVAWPHLTLQYLHRGYFVRAISEHQPSHNLLEGRYAPSVLAIFRSSCVMLAMLQALERVNGDLAKRFWLYWCHGLAAAIVVGSIVAKAPDSPLAQPALDQINAAYELFERAAAQNPELTGRPAKALLVVTRLRFRAHQAFNRSHSGKHAVPAEIPENPDTQDEELQILGGHTRIVAGRTSTTPSTGGTAHSPGSANSPESPQFHRTSPKSGAQRGFTPETLEKAHPSLLADLRSTKETEQHIGSNSYANITGSLGTQNGYERMGGYPQAKYSTSLHNSSMQSQSREQAQHQPAMGSWNNGNSQVANPPYMVPTGYVPAPSDTQSAFGMLGGDPDWDNQWHSFMDQLGMFASDPNAPGPYGTPAMKMER